MTLPVLDTDPVISRPIDNTAMSMYQECAWKYKAAMVLHRRYAGPPSPALAYGSVWHIIMETHYRTGGNEEAVLKAAFDSWQSHGKPDDHRTLDRAISEYYNYLDRWPNENFEDTIGYVEGSPLIELRLNATWPGARHPYAGKIDRIIRVSGQNFIEDHKTTSQMGPYFFKQFELSNQMMGYVVLGELILGQPIAGVRINAHCVLKASSKFEREIMTYSKARLDDWRENYNRVIERIEYSTTNDDFPRNFSACAGKYGMCQYAGVCSVSPRLRDRVLEQDFDLHEWNPLEADGEEGV